MKAIELAENLELPINAVTQRFAFMGNIGSGKSYGASKLAEGMLDLGAQIVVLDCVGTWYGLRILPNGTPSGYDIPIFGGLYGDVPVEPAAGAMLADLIVERRISAIIDVSQFESDLSLQRFAREFMARFFFRKKQSRSAVHLFIEECQEFIPQNPMGEEAKTLHVFQRTLKLGRNFGIGASLISQRPQEVAKKALNLSECLLAFQMNGSQERKAMQLWIEDKNLDANLANELPSVAVGKPWIWSPRWLKVCAQFKILKKKTADVSATPTFDEGKSFAPNKLSVDELSKLGDEIRATVERAKANDPTELKKEIANLTRRVTSAEGAAMKAAKVPEPVRFDTTLVTRAQEEACEVRQQLENLSFDVSKSATEIGLSLKTLCSNLDSFKRSVESRSLKDLHSHAPREIVRSVEIPTRRENVAVRGTGPVNSDWKPSKCAKMLLATLVQHGPCTKAKLSLISGYSKKSSSFTNGISELRVNQCVSDQGDKLAAIDGAESVLNSQELLALPADPATFWLGKLKKAPSALLAALLEAYPNELTREQLAENAGYSITSSSFSNALSALRVGELIEDRGSSVAANPVFSR